MTDKQFKMIWAISSKNGVTKDDLHTLCESNFNTRFSKSLTNSQAGDIIKAIKNDSNSSYLISQKQKAFIIAIRDSLKWENEKLKNFIKTKFHKNSLEELPSTTAWKLSAILSSIHKKVYGRYFNE